MQTLDWLILFAYLAFLTAIGGYYSRKQASLSEYFKGGRRIGWLTIGLSLMAALNSGNDYIQTPSLVFAFGMAYVAQIFSWIPLYPWVTRVTIPFYQRLDVYSAYEYLEQRFGLTMRLVGATIFIFWRVVWMGVALYVPCLAVKGASGGTVDVTWLVLIVGSVVTCYTMLGGIKGVIWTDFAQFCVMFGGLAVALGFVILHVPGGVYEIAEVTQEAHRMSFAAQIPGWAEADLIGRIYLYLTHEVTFIGIIIFVSISRFAAFTGDQMVIQRFQAMATFREARNAFIVNALSDVVWMFVLGGVGLALFAYFQHTPYPAHLQNDQVLPYFMAQVFPAGLKGIVIASIFAASLSSVDSALNSTTSVVVVDFYNRLWLGRMRPLQNLPKDEAAQQVKVSRIVNVVLGVLIIAIAANVERFGEVYSVINRLLGAFFGGLFGIFLLGMFSRRAHRTGVLIGSIAGLAASCFFSFFATMTPLHAPCSSLFGAEMVDFCSHISWQWPPVFGIATTLLIGNLASWLLPRPVAVSDPLTYQRVMSLRRDLLGEETTA